MSLIQFNIHYRTNFGEEVHICGSTQELGNNEESAAIPLTHQDNLWTLTIDIQHTGLLHYYYLIKEHGVITRREWGAPRSLYLYKTKDFTINDVWKDQPYHSYLYTSLFTDAIFKHEVNIDNRYSKNSLLISVHCPHVPTNHQLAIAGDAELLGNWSAHDAPTLNYQGDGQWSIHLNQADLPEAIQFKFVIVAPLQPHDAVWEEGANHLLQTNQHLSISSVQVENGYTFRHHSFSFKGTGTAIPIFSLKSEESFGVGDFNDLRKLVDWAASVEQKMIQILPINDTTSSKTWTDSYPYNAISSYALHPIYLGLGTFPLNNKAKMKAFIKEAKALNQLPMMDYEQAYDLKSRYTQALFQQEKGKVFQSDSYQRFTDGNGDWLFSYAIYSTLRDQFGTADFNQWGEFSTYNEEQLTHYINTNKKARETYNYYTFLQYLLDQQLREVKQYANSKGIGLKGDIPIGINRNSIEAWKEPHLFNMDTQTGAPPDDFSITGQNWGFPTYNWKAMKKEDYRWWKNRFQKMADYFDAYRIDHILGFFRIWEIPIDSVQGLLGQFREALPYWPEELNMADIPFDEKRMTEPFIHEAYLHELFGEATQEVIEQYLEPIEWEQYKLKSAYNTQRKIQQHFDSAVTDQELAIRDGLYTLCNEVLFVRDRISHNQFHPRINAPKTYSFRYLDDHVKDAFYSLYEDFFYHRHNYFWREQAMQKLPPLIASTGMLCCGEDLGMVPDSVPSVMHELQILSLEIQRMPKDIHVAFTQLDRLPYLSISTTSTHDMSPIRLWWREDANVTQNYYNNVLHHPGEAPADCTPKLCKQIIKQHLQSPAMWVILPWQDWLSISEELAHPNPEEERINIPANPRHYWRWRMHMTIEQLMQETELNQSLKKLALR